MTRKTVRKAKKKVQIEKRRAKLDEGARQGFRLPQSSRQSVLPLLALSINRFGEAESIDAEGGSAGGLEHLNAVI